MKVILYLGHFLLKHQMTFRRPGAAALDLAYVASGRAEIFWERKLKPWDVAAGYIIVKEAGGMVTGFGENRADPVNSEGILATNGQLHRFAEQNILSNAK